MQSFAYNPCGVISRWIGIEPVLLKYHAFITTTIGRCRRILSLEWGNGMEKEGKW
jgi:hypothetical protein